eukprot:Seg1719.5 transcript_id=Seg1719.5/GoldUCD/mRNA.D3Y31 product="hypothetical protein" protein_id=Seg1719.5/GoldUCD/D3Y31
MDNRSKCQSNECLIARRTLKLLFLLFKNSFLKKLMRATKMNHPHKRFCVVLLVGMVFILQQFGVKGDSSTATPSMKISNSISVNESEGPTTIFAITAPDSSTSLSLIATLSRSSYSVEPSSLVTANFPTQSTITSAAAAINPSSSAPISSQITPSPASQPISTLKSGNLAVTISTPQMLSMTTPPSKSVITISSASMSQDGSYSTTVAESRDSTESSSKTTNLSSETVKPTTLSVYSTTGFSSTLQPSASTTPPSTGSPSTFAGLSQGASSTVNMGKATTKQVTTMSNVPPLPTPGPSSLSVNSFAVSSDTAMTTAASHSNIVASKTAPSPSNVSTTVGIILQSTMTSQNVSSSWWNHGMLSSVSTSRRSLVANTTTSISVSVMSTISLQPTTDFNTTTMPPTKQPITLNCWGGECSSANRLGEFAYLVTTALIVSCFCVALTH